MFKFKDLHVGRFTDTKAFCSSVAPFHASSLLPLQVHGDRWLLEPPNEGERESKNEQDREACHGRGGASEIRTNRNAVGGDAQVHTVLRGTCHIPGLFLMMCFFCCPSPAFCRPQGAMRDSHFPEEAPAQGAEAGSGAATAAADATAREDPTKGAPASSSEKKQQDGLAGTADENEDKPADVAANQHEGPAAPPGGAGEKTFTAASSGENKPPADGGEKGEDGPSTTASGGAEKPPTVASSREEKTPPDAGEQKQEIEGPSSAPVGGGAENAAEVANTGGENKPPADAPPPTGEQQDKPAVPEPSQDQGADAPKRDPTTEAATSEKSTPAETKKNGDRITARSTDAKAKFSSDGEADGTKPQDDDVESDADSEKSKESVDKDAHKDLAGDESADESASKSGDSRESPRSGAE